MDSTHHDENENNSSLISRPRPITTSATTTSTAISYASQWCWKKKININKQFISKFYNRIHFPMCDFSFPSTYKQKITKIPGARSCNYDTKTIFQQYWNVASLCVCCYCYFFSLLFGHIKNLHYYGACRWPAWVVIRQYI